MLHFNPSGSALPEEQEVFEYYLEKGIAEPKNSV